MFKYWCWFALLFTSCSAEFLVFQSPMEKLNNAERHRRILFTPPLFEIWLLSKDTEAKSAQALLRSPWMAWSHPIFSCSRRIVDMISFMWTGYSVTSIWKVEFLPVNIQCRIPSVRIRRSGWASPDPSFSSFISPDSNEELSEHRYKWLVLIFRSGAATWTCL